LRQDAAAFRRTQSTRPACGRYERRTRRATVADDDTSKREQAQEAILNEIIRRADGSPLSVVLLSEAWAWLMYPNQSHGTSAATK